ncbi:MAG: acyl carrier protein [Clostridia bacterium]|jgi:acyl carrier protein|nr:acyl carrier protein [Clostridia bacterium]
MTFNKLQDLLSKQLHINKTKITPKARIVEDLGADSLDIIEMLMLLEEHFKIEVSDEDALTFKTVGDITNYLDKK